MMTGRRTRRASRGQALVEFAMAFPIVLLILLGILDLGRAVHAYNTVSNAARSAVRVAIVDQNDIAVQTAAEREAVGLGEIVVGPVTYPHAAGGECPKLDCVVRVEVTHHWSAVTPVISQIVGPITISSASELPVERLSP